MERKIGEVFEFEGKMLVVEKANFRCKGCVFFHLDYKDCFKKIIPTSGDCLSKCRTDKNGVIFKYAEQIEGCGLLKHPKRNELVEIEPSESVKNDIIDNKVRMDLLPWPELEEIGKVYTAGAKKYGPNQWQNLEDGYQRYKGAMLRHLTELEKGNDIDEETGCMHAAQIAWNAIAMLHFKLKEKENKE